MPGVYDGIDMRWTWNGDYALSESGDLKDTMDDGLLSLIQDLHTVCASSMGDWEIYPNMGANLGDFIGEPNTRSRASLMNDTLRTAIVSAGIVADKDLSIRIAPVHIHKVLIVLTVNVIPTPFNGLDPKTNAVRTALIFDFVEQGILFWDKIPQLTAL